MKNYRIKKQVDGNGKEWYYPQYKLFIWWIHLREPIGHDCFVKACYTVLDKAKGRIEKDKVDQKERRTKSTEIIEY